MLKKSLIILSIFCALIFTSSICFAANLMQGAESTLNRAGEGIHDMVNGATEAAGNAKDSVSSMVEDIKNGAKSAGDNIHDSMSKAGDSVSGMITNNEYSATRTSATNMTNTGTNFVWIILAIAAIAIVALVWYYGSQADNRTHH